MACEKFKRMISRALDDELSLREKTELEEHLEDCPDCRELEARLKRSAALFMATGRVEPRGMLDSGFAERVAERVAERAADAKRRRPGAVRMALLAAGLALLIGGGGGYLLRAPAPMKPPEPKISSIRLDSNGIGVEIEGDRFVLHTRDKAGGGGIDLKF